MTKKDIFDRIIDVVCECSCVDRARLISGDKERDVVDARVLAVQYLWRAGFSYDEIAVFVEDERHPEIKHISADESVKKRAKNFDKIRRAYNDRCYQSISFCIISKHVSESLRREYDSFSNYEFVPMKHI